MRKAIDTELQEEFEYLGLDLKKLPKFIKESSIPNFNISRLNNDKDLKVYKFVPINKIEILLTPSLRSDTIKKKYSEALPLKDFMNYDGDEEEILLYKTFSKIVRNMTIQEIEKIEHIQESFSINEPFKVKYNRDHLWQIYYSELEDKYFMLVCTKEDTFSEFLYLLKKQIEFSKKRKKDAPKIYVPINYVNYSEEILQKNEIADLENYLWMFTKNWPLIFEVYDNNNELSLQIVGQTFVYKNIKSYYKIVLKSTEEAIKFYKLLKALFILQTEIKGQYSFETKVNSNDELSMYLSKVEITFDSLANFIKNEFLLADYEIKSQNEANIELEKQLSELKKKVKKKEEEYLIKQKEISTYLECKRTFLGKVKYFFKSDKKDQIKNNILQFDDVSTSEKVIVDTQPIKTYVEDKKYYTIEDLVTIYSLHEKGEKYYKNLKQDIKGQELKLENIISKVRNANLYIEEIDKHKKSIFEFWKFANKDEKLALEMAEEFNEHREKKEIKKSFNFEIDFEKLGEEADRLQRKKLSNEELDSLYIAQTELLDLINMLKSGNIEKEKIEKYLEDLKEKFNEDRLVIDSDAFDIFGNITEANNKVKYIGSRSHRELEKSKFKIMNINKKIDIFDFTEKAQSLLNYLDGSIPKVTSNYDISLYKVLPISKNIEEKNYEIFNIDVENELKEFNDEENDGAYNLICLNYKENMPILYYTNAVFFDNTNKTLPIGMNLSTKVLIDNSRLDFLLVNKTKFRTNSYFKNSDEDSLMKSKDIFVYEYDVSLKSDKKIKEDIKINENLETNYLNNEEKVEEVNFEPKTEENIDNSFNENDVISDFEIDYENEEKMFDSENDIYNNENIDPFYEEDNNETQNIDQFNDEEEKIQSNRIEDYFDKDDIISDFEIDYENEEKMFDSENDNEPQNMFFNSDDNYQEIEKEEVEDNDDSNEDEKYGDYYEEILNFERKIKKENVQKSKKMLKMEQKLQKEFEKQKQKEEKARKKLEKKNRGM